MTDSLFLEQDLHIFFSSLRELQWNTQTVASNKNDIDEQTVRITQCNILIDSPPPPLYT